MSRLLLGLGAIVLLAGARIVAPEGGRRAGGGVGNVLGPLRPIVAELRLLALGLRVEEHRCAAALADAQAIVELRPDLPRLWEQLCFRLCLDLPGYEAEPARRGAWYAVGLEFRQSMIERFPNDPSVRRTACYSVLSPLRYDPGRLEAVGWTQSEAYAETLRQALESWRCSGEVEQQLFETQELLHAVLRMGADPELSLRPEQRLESAALLREFGFESGAPSAPPGGPEDSSH